MRVRTGQDVFRLPTEARLPLGPAAWSQWLRRHQSLVTIATVFALVAAVVAARHNVAALNSLYSLPVGNFSPAADVAALNDEAIAESSRLQGLVARINRPIQILPDAGPGASAASLDQNVPDALGGNLEGNPGEIRIYTVVAGDTVWDIAEHMQLAPDSITWSNPQLSAHSHLRIGEKLKIPPTDGVIHEVERDDNLSQLADRYEVTVPAIMAFEPNGLSSTLLSVGNQLFIPGGIVKAPPRTVTPINYSVTIPPDALLGTGTFVHPLERRAYVTQGYWSGHAALDFGGSVGTPIRAVDHGIVAHANYGTNYGYGNLVVVNHGNEYVSLYAHLHTVSVKKDDAVRQGQTIGTLGNTGNSTGPHLHLEIRRNGRNLNPAKFLPSN